MEPPTALFSTAPPSTVAELDSNVDAVTETVPETGTAGVTGAVFSSAADAMAPPLSAKFDTNDDASTSTWSAHSAPP